MKISEELKKERNNLMIVDSLNLCFRFKHAGKKQFAADFINTVSSLANSYEAGKVILAGDMGSEFRKSIYPEYKSNRKALTESQTEEERQEFKEFLEEVDRALELCKGKWKVYKFPGVEADDIAAFIVREFSEDFEHTWLISSDKDWDLLVSDKVSRFSYRTRKETTIENWNDHYLYSPEQHISIKVLTGDKSDSIPGVDGVGEKRAYSILRSYGPTALDVYDNLPIQANYKYIENLNKFGDSILTNYELMDLITYCEDALLGNAEAIKEDFYGN